MKTPLSASCREDGFNRGFMRLLSGHVKAAGPGAAGAGAAMSALRRRELAAIGEKLFRQMKSPTSPLQGLKATMLPGYGQMGSLQQLIASYPGMMRRAAPTEREMVKRLFRQQLEQSFADVGQVAEPKIRFWNTTMPLMGGATAGMGLGLAGGSAAGALQRQKSVEDRLANMSIWDRLEYVLLPRSLNVRPQLPYELRSRQTSSI